MFDIPVYIFNIDIIFKTSNPYVTILVKCAFGDLLIRLQFIRFTFPLDGFTSNKIADSHFNCVDRLDRKMSMLRSFLMISTRQFVFRRSFAIQANSNILLNHKTNRSESDNLNLLRNYHKTYGNSRDPSFASGRFKEIFIVFSYVAGE